MTDPAPELNIVIDVWITWFTANWIFIIT